MAKPKKSATKAIEEKFGLPVATPEKPVRALCDMKLFNIEQRTPEWHSFRAGKVTGTKLKGVLGRTREEWENLLVAESLSVWTQDETDLERGVRLEDEAVAHFEEKTGKKVSKMGCTTREDNLKVASSPDGLIYNPDANGGKGAFDEAVEIKCLTGKKHIAAILGKLDCREKNTSCWEVVPSDYTAQCLQYFIVNDYMHTLYFCFYSEDIQEAPMVVLKITRAEIENEIEHARSVELSALKMVDVKIDRIMFMEDEDKAFMYV